MAEHPPFEGTAFQVKVWNAMKEIPRGEIRTYTEIAVQIGHPNSARAVANACGQNPYPPIVPCHRVVRSDGSLGGYSGEGGVETKRRLLSEEGVEFPTHHNRIHLPCDCIQSPRYPCEGRCSEGPSLKITCD